MHYHEYGSGQEVVLLLHDLAESCLLWQHVAGDLAELDYRVFALDLRGTPSPRDEIHLQSAAY
jgi:alpha-beta hydrolase superfamily lysophospholipase